MAGERERLINEAVGSARGFDGDTRRQNVRQVLAAHMYDISDDPSGSPIERYVSEEDAIALHTFLVIAGRVNWAGADPLNMEKPLGSFNAWRLPRRTAKAALNKALFYREVGSLHRGYVFGALGTIAAQSVAICDDNVLRSRRGSELPRSKAIGWGRLPDHEILNENLALGHAHGVSVMRNARSVSLVRMLVSRVPSEALARVDLSDLQI